MHCTAFGALVLLVAPLVLGSSPRAQSGDEEKSDDETAFTLENIFPGRKKPLFGPRPSGAAFSFDGEYAAWLHKTYEERRHGNDLWLLDVDSGKKRRLTSATLLAEFQEQTREVVDDRVKKAVERRKKKSRNGDEKTGDEKAGDEKDGKSRRAERDAERSKYGNVVGEKDYEDEDAPRYSGVSSFEWSPTGNEMLFVSKGDVYRYAVGDEKPTRLTRTKKTEREVQYLPDGTGYTYLLDGALVKVEFGNHVILQIDPELPSGETMRSYRLSPDGEKLVFLARKGDGVRKGARKVNIARYRDRFMEVREVSRHVSDDPLPETKTMVYLYDLTGALRERGKPRRVHVHDVSGPRDTVRVPEWAPDSSRVTFAVFEQSSQQVAIMEAVLPASDDPEDDAEDEQADEDRDVAKAEVGETSEKTGRRDGESEGDDGEKEPSKPERFVDAPGEVVYRFLHHGGPNTPRMMHPRYCADSRRIVFLSEQTGFRHVHVLDPLYESQRPLTYGRYEVYPFDISEDHRTLYVTATKEHPTRADVYALDLETGELRRMSRKRGVYSNVAVRPDGKAALALFSSYGALRELVYLEGKGRQVALTDSHPDKTEELVAVAPEFFTYENRHGHEIHGFLFKPDGWSKSDRRPLLLYVYGGPLGTRKQVMEGNFHSAGYFFAQYMAREHGFVTCTIDPRGMSGYGGLFEKANFEQVGEPQVEDLTDGVKHMIENYGVDPERVGMHGWSFGGFQTQMCMYEEPDVFKVGIAGAGPTEWENYNSWYSTGTIGNSRTGKTDLKEYSLLPLAKNLEGKLLLVHGMEDSNVLYQDTVRVYRELLKADKETLVELFLDPTGGHGLGGDVTTLRRYRKYEEFLVRNLGEGEATSARDLTETSPDASRPARSKGSR